MEVPRVPRMTAYGRLEISRYRLLRAESSHSNICHTIADFSFAASVPIYGENERNLAMSDVVTPKVQKTDAEWRELLTPDQYRILRQAGTERAFTGPFWNSHEKGSTAAPPVTSRCSSPIPSSIPAAVGRAISRRSTRRRSPKSATPRTAWCAPKSAAAIAAAISATSFPTARRRPACATASMAMRWISRP